MAAIRGWFRPGAGASGLPSGGDDADRRRLAAPGAECLVQGGWIAGDEAGRIAAIAGHPCWRDAGLRELARDRGPAQALLQAYLHDGERLFERLGGDFVLAVLDPAAARLVAGIDRIGQHALHFARIPGGVVFGSSADEVLAHPGIDRSIDPSALYQYLFHHMIPAPVSIYAGLEKLQGAHCLTVADGTVRVRPYWEPRFEEPAGADAQALGARMRELLERAVARLLDGGPTGAFLSGGLDSSSVAGMLARLRPGEADTFSIGFDVEGYDEMAYARIASRHFATRAHEYYVVPQDVVSAVPLIAASYDEPFGNSSALPAYFCARLAADAGIARLLAGDGGDELFAGNARYAKQGTFETWRRVPRILRERILEPAIARLPDAVPLARKARSYVDQARTPLPDRLQTYNFLVRLPHEDMFRPDFLAQVDTDAPWALMRTIYERPAQASALNRMMYLDWQQTLADNDLRKVMRTCRLAGVDVAFPMLDDALIEFSCRVPSTLKLRGGHLRHFYKEAMTGFLPGEIIEKRKHGFGLPFGLWMRDHRPLQELAYDSLLRLKGQDFLRPAFIDHLIGLHREGHAAYYGELIWILMMLDLWLEARRQPQAASSALTG